jgi:dihydropteroate synthase
MLNLDCQRPLVMGILNITPDSFSDGGQLFSNAGPDMDKVLYRAEQLIREGADLLDIGGESTRPGAEPLEPAVELARIVPVVTALLDRFDTPLSVDTSTPQVMTAAAHEGAAMINDVRALRRPGAMAAAAATQLPVILMHMQGEPATMQHEPSYEDVVREVRQFLDERVASCLQAGIGRDRIIIDPGFGFGKNCGRRFTKK